MLNNNLFPKKSITIMHEYKNDILTFNSKETFLYKQVKDTIYIFFKSKKFRKNIKILNSKILSAQFKKIN